MTIDTRGPELRRASPDSTGDAGVTPVPTGADTAPVSTGDTVTAAASPTGDTDKPSLAHRLQLHRITGAFGKSAGRHHSTPGTDTGVARRRDTGVEQERPQGAPVTTPPAAPAPLVTSPVHTTRPVTPRKRTTRASPDAPVTLAEQWGKLTEDRRPGLVWALRALGVLIALGLVGVVIAPPALSAQDIISWARHTGTDSGLGLTGAWAWITFLALDFAAGVCVLVCVYAAIVNTKAGVFSLFVWLFALATAYANYSFGSRPDAPGDAIWFFPAMSLVGPVLLHAVLGFLRKRIKGAAGGTRGRRPSFPLADWNPLTGSLQDTYGAWKTGSLLGVETPDAAIWAYRAISLDAGWFARWRVKKLVRSAQNAALRAKLADNTVAIAIPGLIPDGAFVSLLPDTTVTGDGAGITTGAPLHEITAAPETSTSTVDTDTAASPVSSTVTGAPVTNTGDVTSTGDTGDGRDGGGDVVQLDTTILAKHRDTLIRIFKAYGSQYDSWADLAAAPIRNKLESDYGVSKRKSSSALKHAEQSLPWAEAVAMHRDEASA